MPLSAGRFPAGANPSARTHAAAEEWWAVERALAEALREEVRIGQCGRPPARAGMSTSVSIMRSELRRRFLRREIVEDSKLLAFGGGALEPRVYS